MLTGNPRVTFVAGALLSFPGVSYLDALDHIHKLSAGTVATVLLIISFCLMQQLLLEVPLVGFVFGPKRTRNTISGFRAWMGRSGRTAPVIRAVIGAWLVARTDAPRGQGWGGRATARAVAGVTCVWRASSVRVWPGAVEHDLDRGGGKALVVASLDLSFKGGLLGATDELAAPVDGPKGVGPALSAV